jgi:hypothetical protein
LGWRDSSGYFQEIKVPLTDTETVGYDFDKAQEKQIDKGWLRTLARGLHTDAERKRLRVLATFAPCWRGMGMRRMAPILVSIHGLHL